MPDQRRMRAKHCPKVDGVKALCLKAKSLYDQNRIDLGLGRKVVSIDRGREWVHFEDGDGLGYDYLALATGARNRRPDIPGLDHPAILELRGLDHSRALLDRLPVLNHVTIIGGGFIGLEVAALLREKGVAVAIVELAPRLMARAVSEPISNYFLDFHRGMGADVHLQCTVSHVRHDPDVVVVQLSDCRTPHSDAV